MEQYRVRDFLNPIPQKVSDITIHYRVSLLGYKCMKSWSRNMSTQRRDLSQPAALGEERKLSGSKVREEEVCIKHNCKSVSPTAEMQSCNST